MQSIFGEILREAVARVPGAVGGTFAAKDGEAVDSYNIHDDDFEWAVLTAHYGIILSHVQSALNTFHFGEAEVVIIAYRDLDILMHSVGEGYYALLATQHPCVLSTAMRILRDAATRLREEMG